MENALSTSNLTRIGWIKLLEDLGYQAKFIHQDHLLGGALERDGTKVLVLNRTLCLSDAEAAAIRTFAAGGGVVIADHLCGVFDEHGKAREKGALDDLFGIRHDLAQGILGGKTLSEVDAEKGAQFSTQTWAIDGALLHQRLPIFERGLGAVLRKDRHTYLNLSPAGYLLQRGMPESKGWLELVSSLLGEAGVKPRAVFSLGGDPARTTEALYWKNGERITLCVVQNLDRHASIDTFGTVQGTMGDSARKLTISFGAPVKGLVNERTGREMGDGKLFGDDFTPWEANVYTFTP